MDPLEDTDEFASDLFESVEDDGEEDDEETAYDILLNGDEED